MYIILAYAKIILVINLQFTNIEQAINFVSNRRNFQHGFAHFARFMASINDPQDQFKSVHIAGTNGKGSVTNYLKDILRHSGYKVGTFTSPHLISHLDRIRINDEWISPSAFLYYLNKYLDDIIKWELSMFEIDMLIMSTYFRDQQVDIAIVETGLGGRLDSTNVLHHPLADAIVTIGYDHMDRLGDTLEKIAKEKAGIIKKNAQVIIGKMDPWLENVIMAKARCNHIHHNVYEFQGDTLWVDGRGYKFTNKALYQRHNLAMALNIAKNLPGFVIKYDGLSAVLAKSNWAGRFEIMQEDPLIIIDGAHNLPGIMELKRSITALDQPFNIIFAALRDKDPLSLVRELEPIADELIVTQFPFYRCCPIEDYPDKYAKFADFTAAIEQGIKMKKPLLICGSLYFISDVRNYLLKKCHIC